MIDERTSEAVAFTTGDEKQVYDAVVKGLVFFYLFCDSHSFFFDCI